MSLSLAAEPRRRGLFEPYFWTRLSQLPSVHPLAALLFPEPLPTVCFVNRQQIARGRLESNASLNVPDIRDLRLQPDGDKTVRGERPKLGGLDLGGTLIPVFDGELLLLVQPGGDHTSGSRPASRAPSRPPSAADTTVVEKMFSRTPSIRVTPGSSHGHGTERKPSLARRNSLPSMSRRTSLVASEVTSERPLRVVVQAGTLDRLVDVLVHGLQGVSVSVADDNGEMPLTDRKTREVRVDMDDFSHVWWNVYRSFVKPEVLFEVRHLARSLRWAPYKLTHWSSASAETICWRSSARSFNNARGDLSRRAAAARGLGGVGRVDHARRWRPGCAR